MNGNWFAVGVQCSGTGSAWDTQTNAHTHVFRAPSRQSELFPQQWSSTANVPIVKEKVDTTGTIIFAQWLAALSVSFDLQRSDFKIQHRVRLPLPILVLKEDF